jgi:DNA mismatch repair protein MutL
MSDIIQLLPDSIANQIAAGEVVQRPASAVKELLENAIDAHATHITLLIKDAGKSHLQVIDNGSGMSETDARLSIERHATSKIRKAEDLFTLQTMGFRGEALASIAAIAQVEMKTRLKNQELGTLLVVEGSEVKKQELVACEGGTNISVKNLFFNIPARRNFLKSNSVEFRHIMDEFQRVALAYPEISFTFMNGEVLEFDLPASKLSQRIVSIFGKNYQQQLAPCSEETERIRITGYVGKPESAKRTRGEQFLFVNRRFIKSNYLNHAISGAYTGLLPEGSFPFYVLYIEIDPKHIDVNVHPTKTEIKFDDERSIYGIVLAAVRQALGAHSLMPALDFQADVNIVSKLKQSSGDDYFDERFQRSNLQNWERLMEGNTDTRMRDGSSPVHSIRFDSRVNQAEEEEVIQPAEKVLSQLFDRYILKQVRSGMMIVDQQLAHERILFERYLNQLRNKHGESQQCLFPQTIVFSPADFAMVMEMEQEIHSLGFRLEEFGKNTLVVNGIPANLPGGREKELVEGLIEQFKSNQKELSVPIQENLARALAKRSANKAGKRLALEEMHALLGSLFACKSPNYSPDGKPTFFIFELSKIESYFNRL